MPIAFPSKLLILSLTLTMLSMVWIGVSTHRNYNLINSRISENVQVGRLTYEVMRLDGILTESARQAAATGDPKWEARYNEHVTQLDEVLAKLHKVAGSSQDYSQQKDFVKQTDEANKILVDMETQVFNFVHEKKLLEAQKVISSDDYFHNKEIYAKGMHDLVDRANRASNDPLFNFARTSYYGIFPIICAALILAVVWYFTLSSLRVWRVELVNTRNTLKAEKTYLDTILNNIMQGVITIDKHGIIRSFNKWAEAMFGYTSAEIIGKNVSVLMPEPHASQHDKYMRDFMETGISRVIDIGREVPAITSDNVTFPALLSVTKFEKDGEPIFIGLMMDITLLKEKELKLRQAKREADNANRAKSDFLANMSHELRTPLNSILGLTKILLEEEDTLSKEARDSLGIIDKASLSLLNTVNDILDLSKIEAGYIQLVNKPFNVTGLILSLVDQIKPLASKKGLVVKGNVDELSNIYVSGDEFRLFRIMLNLAGNAVKYTNKGFVEFNVRCEDISDNHINFIFTVRDSGIGIPYDKIGKIFDKFTQADETIERKYGGTGLGLSITKHLTEIMNGTITAKSEVGKGSEFTVVIPLEKTDKINVEGEKQELALPVNVKKIPVDKARILIAEDHAFNQVLVTKIVTRLGCKNFIFANDGKEAVEAFGREKFDAVLMDIHMPEMSGHEATKWIRNKERELGITDPVPIIAMTADVMPGTREDCLQSGMNEYISKPVDEDSFRKIMSQWFVLAEKKKKAPADHPPSSGNGAAPADLGAKAPVNLSFVKDYAEHDPEVEQHLVRTFYEKSMTDLKNMKANLSKSRHKSWAEFAHRLKGSAGYLGAEDLKTLCQTAQLMEDAKSTDKKETLKLIHKEFDNVCAYLKSCGYLIGDHKAP